MPNNENVNPQDWPDDRANLRVADCRLSLGAADWSRLACRLARENSRDWVGSAGPASVPAATTTDLLEARAWVYGSSAAGLSELQVGRPLA